MKLKAKITMLVNHDQTTIKIEDANANIVFCEVTLTPEQLSMALSRLAYVPCEMFVNSEHFDKIGKVHENKSFVFELPEDMSQYNRDKTKLQPYAQTLLTDGWEADDYFNSQDSFFSKDGRDWARCTIRRWN